MYRTFNIYLNDKQKVSEALLGLLGFVDYASGQWIRDESNSAIVDELVHALTDIGYEWVVGMDYEDMFEEGTRHFTNLAEWSEWYDN